MVKRGAVQRLSFFDYLQEIPILPKESSQFGLGARKDMIDRNGGLPHLLYGVVGEIVVVLCDNDHEADLSRIRPSLAREILHGAPNETLWISVKEYFVDDDSPPDN